MQLSDSEIFGRNPKFESFCAKIETEEDFYLNRPCIRGISTFEYILALRMGYIMFSDVIRDYTVYTSQYGAPDILYKLVEGFSFPYGNAPNLNTLREIVSMINSFPLYGEDFSKMEVNTYADKIQLSVFKYGPDYDKCTMSYDDYKLLVLIAAFRDDRCDIKEICSGMQCTDLSSIYEEIMRLTNVGSEYRSTSGRITNFSSALLEIDIVERMELKNSEGYGGLSGVTIGFRNQFGTMIRKITQNYSYDSKTENGGGRKHV